MKTILVITVLTFLAACSSGEDQSISSRAATDSIGLSDIAKTTAWLPLSASKNCQSQNCASYVLTIDKQHLLSVSYSSKKSKAISFVLTHDNFQVLNQRLNEFEKSQSVISNNCLQSVSTEPNQVARFDLNLGDSQHLIQHEFMQGCDNTPESYKQLADWFDTKAYAMLEN